MKALKFVCLVLTLLGAHIGVSQNEVKPLQPKPPCFLSVSCERLDKAEYAEKMLPIVQAECQELRNGLQSEKEARRLEQIDSQRREIGYLNKQAESDQKVKKLEDTNAALRQQRWIACAVGVVVGVLSVVF